MAARGLVNGRGPLRRSGRDLVSGYAGLLDFLYLLLCVEPDDVQDDLAGFLHAFEREVLHLSVEIVASGEDVRTWKSHERQVRSVCTSADRLHLRCDAFHLDGLHRLLYDVVVRLDLLAHVVVLVLDLADCRAFAVLSVDEVDACEHVCLLLLVEVHVVVANDV